MASNKIPKKRINRAIKNANILELLKLLDIRVTKKTSHSSWFLCQLLSHRGETKASTHIVHNRYDAYHGIWHCFGCKQSGTIIDLVKIVRDIPFREALIIVESNQHSDYIEDSTPVYVKKDIRLPTLYMSPPSEEDWKEEYIEYLKGRDIPWWQIKRHNIGYVDDGKLANRIIVPVTLGQKLVTYVARTILEDEKLRVTSAANGTRGLFNSDFAKFDKPAIITEGWGDALRIERCGYYNSFSSQINSLSPKMVEFLKKFPYVILIPDNDAGGIKFVNSMAPFIDELKLMVARLPGEYKDPDDCKKSNVIEESIAKAKKWKPVKDRVKFLIDY
jgi:DNA primase